MTNYHVKFTTRDVPSITVNEYDIEALTAGIAIERARRLDVRNTYLPAFTSTLPDNEVRVREYLDFDFNRDRHARLVTIEKPSWFDKLRWWFRIS